MSTYICTSCGYEGAPKKILKGSKAVEIAIWAVLLIPGPFYSAWRRIGARIECPNCKKSGTMVKRSSAEAQLYMEREFETKFAGAKKKKPLEEMPVEEVEAEVIKPEEKPLNPPQKTSKPAPSNPDKTPVNPEEW